MTNSIPDSAATMARPGAFSFVSLNPSVRGLEIAAHREGGACVLEHEVGPVGDRPFRGPAGKRRSDTKGDIVVAALPFSMFVRAEGCDPGVMDVIEQARAAAGSAVLFRVPWLRAARLGVAVDEYSEAVSAVFEDQRWHVSTAVTDELRDMFICAVLRRKWNGTEPLPASWPNRPEAGTEGDALRSALGYRQDFHRSGIRDEDMVDAVNTQSAIACVRKALKR